MRPGESSSSSLPSHLLGQEKSFSSSLHTLASYISSSVAVHMSLFSPADLLSFSLCTCSPRSPLLPSHPRTPFRPRRPPFLLHPTSTPTLLQVHQQLPPPPRIYLNVNPRSRGQRVKPSTTTRSSRPQCQHPPAPTPRTVVALGQTPCASPFSIYLAHPLKLGGCSLVSASSRSHHLPSLSQTYSFSVLPTAKLPC